MRIVVPPPHKEEMEAICLSCRAVLAFTTDDVVLTTNGFLENGQYYQSLKNRFCIICPCCSSEIAITNGSYSTYGRFV